MLLLWLKHLQQELYYHQRYPFLGFLKLLSHSLMMSLPDTLLSVRLSYNTVPALALRVQSKKAGTLIADAVVLFCVALVVVAVAVVAGLLEAVAGCIKSLTTNLLDDRLKFPFNISFLKTNPYRLSIVPLNAGRCCQCEHQKQKALCVKD